MDTDLTTAEGLRQANEELAKLVGMGTPYRSVTGVLVALDDGCCVAANFFAGLRPDGTCDEALVDGALLWRVECAIRHHLLWVERTGWRTVHDVRVDSSEEGGRAFEATHAHPMVALYRCLRAAGI